MAPSPEMICPGSLISSLEAGQAFRGKPNEPLKRRVRGRKAAAAFLM